MPIDRAMKNALLTAGSVVTHPGNAPAQYTDKQHEYYVGETKLFSQQTARYSSDYVEARVQGIDPTEPYAWQTRRIRMAEIVRPSAATLQKFDGRKIVLFADRDIEYIVPGSKIETMGSTWLVTNPENISGSDGKTIVERCNTAWNYLDFYGNVRSEPMVVSNHRADANMPDAQEHNLIPKGYFQVQTQYNEVTRQIDDNTRFILGSRAYFASGVSDFFQEFTGDYGSVRVMEFTLRTTQVNAAIDDLENHVAGARNFRWEIQIFGPSQMVAGNSATFRAISERMGNAVESTDEHPISYIWTSSDETVAIVDMFGNVSALAEGDFTLTAALAQNPAITASLAVSVEASGETGVKFTSSVPAAIGAYEDAELTAAYFEDGAETDEPLIWEFSGAEEGTYRAATGAKSATIYCFGYSRAPLHVTVSHGTYSAEADIPLEAIV